METVHEKKTNVWMIVAIIFMILTIACGVAAALAYINMPDKEQIAADAKSEAKDDYDKKVSELKGYYESKIKSIEAEKNKAIKEATGEGSTEEYDDKWDALNGVSTVNVSSARDYIYLPVIGKKLKVSSELKNVKYLTDDEGVMIWATSADSSKDDYDFNNPDKNINGMIRLEVLSKKYIDAYLKIDSSDEWMKSFANSSIISGNGNVMRRGVASLTLFSAPGTSEYKAEDSALTALIELVSDKNNYEDL